ncbi:MAG: DHHA1 domain-containing protein, partial [Thermodesulfobacteriota bacterium]|nr:DHHA1 domain-containing protein [Thermodesulfobacteriota bacterium]
MAKKIKAPILITAHANADFDALASMVAAGKLYPGAVLVFPGSQEKNLRNFYIQSAMYLFNFRSVKEVNLSSVKTLVVVDTRQKSRLRHVQRVFKNPGLAIHAYDHHPDSSDDLKYTHGIVRLWGSAAAILVHEIRKKNIALTNDEATIIGLGIYEDTGSFTFDSTTSFDLEAAAWLLTQGMNVGVISDLIVRDLNVEQISLLNALLESAHTHEIKGVPVVVAEVTTEEYTGDFALLAHKMMDVENVRVLFALGRMHDRIHLVARSRSPEVDVGYICASFGGGGHKFAASASIKDK